MTGVWVTGDVITAARANEKTVFQGTGAAISGLATTYSGQLAFCTSSGSGFTINILYQRNAANTSWDIVGAGQSGDQVYPLDTTIGNYSTPSAVVASSTLNSFDFSISTGWTTNDSASLNVDTAGGTIDFDTDATNAVLYYDFGAGNISDSSWNLRFKYVAANFSAAAADIQRLYIVMSNNTSNASTSNDSIGFQVRVDSAGSLYQACYADGGLPAANTQNFAESVGAETFYIEIKRTSTTSFTVSLYSDSTYTTLVEAEVVTIPSSISGLRYLKLLTISEATTNELNGTIDDMYYNLSSATPNTFTTSAYAIDDSTSTAWTSNSENNPNIYVDLGSAKEFHMLALNINKTLTTETEIQIRFSSDTTFTSGENVRTLLISDFTDDTWRFITIPRSLTDKRYVQIYGSSNSVILSINEIKYLSKSTADFERGHYHRYISPTDTTDTMLDSN